jgi:acetolactate synthase-1/3 small subunit
MNTQYFSGKEERIMQHTIIALVEDKPGVLNRIVSLFRKRNFNIDSLTVSKTQSSGVSRMTITLDNSQVNVSRLIVYLEKLINVLKVEDLTFTPMVCRDLALIKVRATAQNRSEIMQLVDTFRARIVDVAADSFVIEITGANDKIQSFVDMMQSYGIQEFARSGAVGMARGRSALAALPQHNTQVTRLPEPVLVRP